MQALARVREFWKRYPARLCMVELSADTWRFSGPLRTGCRQSSPHKLQIGDGHDIPPDIFQRGVVASDWVRRFAYPLLTVGQGGQVRLGLALEERTEKFVRDQHPMRAV